MTVRLLFLVDGIIALVFGGSFIAAPQPSLAIYGISLATGGALLTRLFGAALAGHGIVQLASRSIAREAARGIVLGQLVFDIAGAAIALEAVLSGTMNAAGWSTVVIFGVFALIRARILISQDLAFARSPAR